MQKIIWLNHRDIRHPRTGGAERTILEVSSRLVMRGYKVAWLSTNSQGLPREENINGIEILRLGGNISAHMKNLIFERKQLSDTLVIDDLAHVVPWLSERFSSLPGTVFFRHMHRRTLDGQLPPLKAAILKKIEAWYPRIYKKWSFVTESKQGVHDLEEIGIPYSRIERIPPGVDFTNLGLKEKYERPSLIYFGGMRDYKRPYEAIYLLQKLKQIYPDITLRISGSGPSLNPMRLLSRKLGLDDHTEYLGRLDEDKLFDTVSRSWVNLHFSKAEGWGLSIIEASSCGTPTLAYDVPGVSEVIFDGHNGKKVIDMDREKLFETAVNMIENYKLWVNSSRNVALKFSWDKTTDMWEKHLQSCYGEQS